MRSFSKFCAVRTVGILFILCSLAARGDIVNDVDRADAYQILYHTPIGQTFIAVDSTIHTISVGIVDMNPDWAPNDHDLALLIFPGAGFIGPPIAMAYTDNIADRHVEWLDFVFETPIPTVVGEQYTIQVIDDSVRWAVEANGNAYLDGFSWFHGKESAERDLRFRVLAEFRPGACCAPSLCLDNVDVDTCVNNYGGVHAGTGSYCFSGACDTGACCDDIWGFCIDVLPLECFNHGSDWYFTGRSTSCQGSFCAFDAYGACCHGTECTDGDYMSRGKCEEEGGTWAGPNTVCRESPCPPCPLADADQDADLDLLDFARLQACIGGRAAGACLCSDFQPDSFIDLVDVNVFVQLSESWPFPQTIPHNQSN